MADQTVPATSPPLHRRVAMLHTVKRRIESVLFSLIAALLLALAVMIGLQVFYRYVLNDSLAWTEESARLVLVWMTFLGAGLASFRGVHLRLDIIAHHLTPGMKRAREAAITGAILLFLGVLLTGNADVIEIRESLPFTSFDLSSKYLSYAISAGAAVMAVGTVVSFILAWFDATSPRRD